MNPQISDHVPETTFTRWHNPTDHEQRVVLHGPRGQFKFVVPAGETRELDSTYDRAIQHVDCGKDECHRKRAGGWWCTEGHEGQIVGGLAPLLKRVGKGDKLDPVLDPKLAEKKELEAQLAAQDLVARGQERAAVIAAAKLAELDRATAPDPKPAPQHSQAKNK